MPSVKAQAAPENALKLNLPQCIEIALSQNRSLQLTENSLALREKSLEAAGSEFDVKYFPTAGAGAIDGEKDLSAGMTARKKLTLGPELAFFPRVGTFGDSYTGEIGVSLDIPLFRNFGQHITLDGVRSNEFSVRSATRNVYLSQANTIISTVSAVYRILEQDEQVGINREQVRRLKSYAALSKVKEKVNLATPIDVYRSLIRLRDAENRLSVSIEALDDAYDNLKIVLALPIEKEIRVQAPLDLEPVAIELNEAVATAMENRIEIAQERDALDEAQRRAFIAGKRILPDVRLRMGYSRFGVTEASAGDLSLSEDTWQVTVTTSSDLFRTTEKIGYQQSLYEVENARLSLQSIQEDVQREVRREFAALDKALERIRISEKQIHEARGKLALAEIKFNHGLADNFDLIEAETELQQAQVNLVSTRIDYIVGRYRLRETMGTLVEYRENLLP